MKKPMGITKKWLSSLKRGLKRKYWLLSGHGILLITLIAQLARANPSAMIQALLGVGSPVSPAVLINPPSGVYFSPYLNVTVSTAMGATYFKSKVGPNGSIDCSNSTGYSAETIIADSPTSSSLFANPTPTGTANDGHPYELGMKFQTYFSGKITGVRYYKPSGETGTHTGRIWDNTQALLSSVAFSGETSSGWQLANFATPVAIVPDVIYTVSVNANGDYPYTHYGLQNVVTNGQLSSVVTGSNGSFANTAGTFPDSGSNQSDYYRDVVFTRTSHIIDDLSSLGGGNLKLCVVVRDSNGNWQDFSSATQVTWYQAAGLLGSTYLISSDSNVAESAEAFQFTATNTGTANYVRVYARSGSAATTLIAGIYSDNSDSPQTLLGTGSLSSPTADAWNSVTLGTSVPITAGTKYWIAILGTGGTLNFFSSSSGTGPSCMSSSTNLTSLPGTWTSGSCQNNSPSGTIAY